MSLIRLLYSGYPPFVMRLRRKFSAVAAGAATLFAASPGERDWAAAGSTSAFGDSCARAERRQLGR